MHDTFARSLLDPGADVRSLVSAADITAARFDVHRNNVMSALIDALRDAFPALRRLLGDEYFDALAAEFVRGNPPCTPLLVDYGDKLPAFVERHPPLDAYPYLGDVARLERLRIRAFHARDEAPGAFDDLHWFLATADEPGAARLVHSASLLSSVHPVHTIWASQFDDGVEPDARRGAESVLVWRRGFETQTAVIGEAAECFLSAIVAGLSARSAIDELGDAGLGFETMLDLLLRDHVLVANDHHFTAPEGSP